METVTYFQPIRQCDIETTVQRTTDTDPMYPDRERASFEQSSDRWTVEVTHEYTSPTMSPIDHAVMLGLISPDASYADFEAALPEGMAKEDVGPHAPETVRVQYKYEYRPYTGGREGIDARMVVYEWGERAYQLDGNDVRYVNGWFPYYDGKDTPDSLDEELLIADGQFVERYLDEDHEWATRPHSVFGDVAPEAFPWHHALGHLQYSHPPENAIVNTVFEERGDADYAMTDLLDTDFDPETYRHSQRGDNADSAVNAD